MKTFRLSTNLSATFLALCLAGCTTPDFKRPAVDIPTAWRVDSTSTESLADLPWGMLFRTAELQALINTALTENSDLRIAAARVELVRAQYGIQRSNLFPTVRRDYDIDIRSPCPRCVLRHGVDEGGKAGPRCLVAAGGF